MRRSSDSPTTLHVLAHLATKSICVATSSNCLKALISQLSVYNDSRISVAYQQAHVSVLLDSFLTILSAESSREVFAFSGKPGCGVGLVARKSLPKTGYCFCGWIRVERADVAEKMTVFKLGASKNREIELFFKDGYLHYSVCGWKRNEGIDGRYKDEGTATCDRFFPEKD